MENLISNLVHNVKRGWIITKGHNCCKDDTPLATKEQLKAIKKAGFLDHFKMFDDDGMLYYSGYVKPDPDQEGFEPLDDYGTPNAGCTEIQYRNPKTLKYDTL